MYVTLEPCPMCATAIVNSRIKEVYFGAYDNLYGALGSKLNIEKIFNSSIKIKGGICEDVCSDLLKNFWRSNG
jgi:tRNA(adenine34) deaminase